MNKLPPLNWLRSFEASARHLSFTAAGEELHITQSAVSQQVKLLENFVGKALFLRRPRRLQLTDAARNYLPAVTNAFQVLRDGTAPFLSPTEGRVVEVKANMAFSVYWLMPHLEDFIRTYPNITVQLSTALSNQDFAGADSGVEIRYGRGEWGDLKGLRLKEEHIYPVCSPILAETLSSPEDLDGKHLLHVIHLADGWEAWADKIGGDGLDVSKGHHFDTFALAYNMAERGLGVTLGRDTLCEDMLSRGVLVKPFEAPVPALDNYYLVLPSGEQSTDEAIVFHNWILEQF